MYDIAVIGAEPFESTAAKLMAEECYSVLLLERMELPRYKSFHYCKLHLS